MNYKANAEKYALQFCETSVWLKINQYLLIGDLEKKDYLDVKKLIRKLKQFSFLIGCREIVMTFSPDSYWDLKLREHLTPEKGFPIIGINLTSSLPIHQLKLAFADIDTF